MILIKIVRGIVKIYTRILDILSSSDRLAPGWRVKEKTNVRVTFVLRLFMGGSIDWNILNAQEYRACSEKECRNFLLLLHRLLQYFRNLDLVMAKEFSLIKK